MSNISLNEREVSLLTNRKSDLQLVSFEIQGQGLLVNDAQADLLRDALGELLQDRGFGADYKLTEDGKIIQGLIDKLLIR